jgi:hypothetical protein
VVALGVYGGEQRGDDVGQAGRRGGGGGRGPLGAVCGDLRLSARRLGEAWGPAISFCACERGRGLLTLAVRRMLLDLPAQLGDVAPPAGAARVVELGNVAQRLVALGVVLRQRELECGHDVARGGSSRRRQQDARRREGNVHPFLVRGGLSLQAGHQDAQNHARGRNTGGGRLQHCKRPSHPQHVVPRRGVNAGDAPLSLGGPLASAIQKSSPAMQLQMLASCSHRPRLQDAKETEWHQWRLSWPPCVR